MPAALNTAGLRFGCLVAALLALGPAVSPAAAQTPQAFQYRNFSSTTAATTLKSSPGVLHSVCINTPAATGVITIYDSLAASGTKIATLTSFASVTGCFVFDTAFWVGLTISIATASPDTTVSFR